MLEEIILKNLGDTVQNFRIDGWFIENFVCICSAKRHLAGKPDHCTTLFFQFLFDKLTDMHNSSFYAEDSPVQRLYNNKGNEITKKSVGNQSLAYPTTQALALPLRKDKQRQSAHACMI